MLLNPYNCFHIEGHGIYVYFPELNRLFFYAHKKDKDFEFSPEIESKGNEIIFKNKKGNNKLHLQPFFQLKEFEKYFERQKSSKKIDFFIMNKFTKKLLTTSKIEPRIVRIDWMHNLIRYYGPDERGITVYDVIVPDPTPKGVYMIDESSYKKLLEEHPSNYEFKKFLFQIFYPNDKNPLQNPSNPSQSNPELDEYLQKLGFLNTNQTTIDLLDIFNSTELKKDWKKYITEKLEMKPLLFMHDDSTTTVTLNNHYQQIDLARNNLYYKLLNNSQHKHPPTLTHIDVKINDELHRINITKEDLFGESKKCGADNCFKMTKVNGKNYGVRFSKNILFDGSVLLYDTMIEMLINCISYFTLHKLKGPNQAAIQEISGLGFYKVKVGNKKTGEDIFGYIPYTVVEMNEPTITLYDLLLKILNGDPSIYTIDKIKSILGTVCLQIYNFYNVMYPSIKFEHNDFKIDNIVVNPETLQVYIIDFGLSRINAIFQDRNYQIFKREVKELERTNDVSDFYFYISDIYKKLYLNRQADIEKLTVWLKDVSVSKSYINHENYKTVIETSLIPNIKFLGHLSLKNIETSDKLSYYKEQELKSESEFITCEDLFIYTMDEFKRSIDSLSDKPLTESEAYSRCNPIITSKSPSPSSSSSPSLAQKAVNLALSSQAGGTRKTRKIKNHKKGKQTKLKLKNRNI